MMKTSNLLIISIKNDLHALVIKQAIKSLAPKIKIYILETDKISEDFFLNWNSNSPLNSSITFPDNSVLYLNQISLIWLRRITSIQKNNYSTKEELHGDFVNKNCCHMLMALLSLIPDNKWVSSMHATEKASDKMWQLIVASKNGLTVPDTLISNDPNEVKKFSEKNSSKIIIKPYQTANHHKLLTQHVNMEQLNPKQISICPAIYQEYVPGNQHLRINLFGDLQLTAKIISESLDWRPNLDVTVTSYILPDHLIEKLQNILKDLNLKMGIIDMKINDKGEFIWLEINPQGQFLFLEPLIQQNITQMFASFLIEQIK